MDLMTLIVCWTVVTTIVVVLAYTRMSLGLHDIMEVHLASGPSPVDPHDVKRSKTIAWLDRIGIPLSVVSVLMMIAILLVWAAEQGGMR